MEKLFLNSIRRGEKLRPRDDVLPYAKEAGKRRYRRYAQKFPIAYFLPDINVGRPAYSLDVSEEGLSVDLPEKLEVGQNLKLKLFHTALRSTIEIIADIVWIKLPFAKGEMYRSGMSITKMSVENGRKWKALLEEVKA